MTIHTPANPRWELERDQGKYNDGFCSKKEREKQRGAVARRHRAEKRKCDDHLGWQRYQNRGENHGPKQKLYFHLHQNERNNPLLQALKFKGRSVLDYLRVTTVTWKEPQNTLCKKSVAGWEKKEEEEKKGKKSNCLDSRAMNLSTIKSCINNLAT